jgi:acetyl esterase/lipase
VNYRHTPEWHFPTAWNDTEDAFIWVHENIAQVCGLNDQVFVGGISAGAQLAASLCLAHISGENKALAACPKIQGQVLMIPWLVQLDHYAPRQEKLRAPEVSSLVQCAEAPVLPIERIKLFVSLLGRDEVHDAGNDLRLNPGNATEKEVTKLPPTTFGIAGYDPLRDEGLFYAKLLNENG